MARAGERPVADLHRGLAAFTEHLPRVLRGRTLEERGWRKPTALSLLVPMSAGPNGEDDYLLRLGFEYYPVWPPSALFVNPQTLTFDAEMDLYWLPRVENDPGLAVHKVYHHNHYNGQLICCSFTLEFYLIEHGVQPGHLWDSERFTFEATIERIQHALRSSFYRGRHSPRKPQDHKAEAAA